MTKAFARAAFGKITGTDETDWSKQSEGLAGFLHVGALSLSKLADGLINPKLVLSWLLDALGAPDYLIAALVPVREAGALLPQAVLAPQVEKLRMRRWVWVIGSAMQGLMALLIGVSAFVFSGVAAGWAIVTLLAVLAVSRSACSVSYKDILGKTVGQSRRGAVTGLAGSVASLGVFVFALLMILGVLQSHVAVAMAVIVAGCLWLVAAFVLSLLPEEASEIGERSGDGIVSILMSDANLRRFILVRGLLVSTALAPPYLVILASDAGHGDLGQLGILLLASAGASFVSSYFWGRLADASGRKTLALSGLCGALALGAAVLASLTGFAAQAWVVPLILFALMVAYHGVRQARSTYLVDVSPAAQRAGYAAAANTVIGSILLLAGLMGGVLSFLGPNGAIIAYALMALAGGVLALQLKEA